MITWIMVFAYYYPSINQVVMSEVHDFATKTECIETLDKQFTLNVENGYQLEHMAGWCYEQVPNTLEMKPNNSKPELLK